MIESTLARPSAPGRARIDSAHAATRANAIPAVEAGLFRGLLSAALIYTIAFGLYFALV